MTNPLNTLMENKFWADWERKFTLNHSRYINPELPEVTSTARSLNIKKGQNPQKIADGLWDFVRENHDYSLTKKWRRPDETLNGGVGDCEDYVFLIGSLLPHFGVTEYTIHAGEAFFDGGSEFHVWMEVNGKVIDPTAPKSKVPGIEYVPELTFKINTEK